MSRWLREGTWSHGLLLRLAGMHLILPSLEEAGERLNKWRAENKMVRTVWVNSYNGFIKWAIPLRSSRTVGRSGGQISSQSISSFNYVFMLSSPVEVVSLMMNHCQTHKNFFVWHLFGCTSLSCIPIPASRRPGIRQVCSEDWVSKASQSSLLIFHWYSPLSEVVAQTNWSYEKVVVVCFFFDLHIGISWLTLQFVNIF